MDQYQLKQLLNDADVFFSNRRQGYQERYGLAEENCSRRPGLFHAKFVLHGTHGLIGLVLERLLAYHAAIWF
jgi:crotonobetainyl-CoA:carnitine CoA-transferase CaiB-like acyl-CoA transferase